LGKRASSFRGLGGPGHPGSLGKKFVTTEFFYLLCLLLYLFLSWWLFDVIRCVSFCILVVWEFSFDLFSS
jgi:hypothetical protein